MANYFHEMVPEKDRRFFFTPTLPEYVAWIADTYRDKPALSDTQVTYSYAEMASRIARRRTYLKEMGLRQGDHVAVLDVNTIDAVEMFLAITTAGMVALMLPAQLPNAAIVGACKRFDIKALAVREAFKERVEGVGCSVFAVRSMSEDETEAAQVKADDAAAIYFTGGTTGAPKGAVLPHRALMRGSYNGCFAPVEHVYNQRTIGLLPLSHIFGMVRGTLSALQTGALWYAADDMKTTIGKLPVIKPTMLVLVPGLCDTLIGLTKMYGVQFLGGELKMIISGAANVPPRLITAYDQIGVKLLAGYGMTEGANLTTGNADVLTHPTSIGKVYPEQEVKLVDNELWIKGDNLFLGYYKDEENTRAALTEDGWLRTGDLARIDEDGFLYITGRIKNLIILSNGENVSPESIEEPFYKCDELKDCLVKEEDGVLSIEILPQPSAIAGKTEEEVYDYFKEVVKQYNATAASTHRISKMTIRKEDFKRTGAMKVSRNQ